MFLTVVQNNSGGYWIVMENVARIMIFECDSVGEAEEIFNGIPGDHHFYCDCCGPRWDDFDFYNDNNLTETPMIYGVPAREYKSDWIFFGDDKFECIIHYKDGTRERFEV